MFIINNLNLSSTHLWYAYLSSFFVLILQIGNGFIDSVTDTQGIYDYWWSQSLISKSTHVGLMHCLRNITYECQELQKKAKEEMGSVNVYNLNLKSCQISDMATKPKYVDMDPCYIEFASGYLNIRQVQQSLHVKRTTMQYLWHMCRLTPILMSIKLPIISILSQKY